MKKIYFLFLLLTSFFMFPQNDLELQGVIDFTVPSGGSDGKAIHLVANADIADLSIYGIGVANNGGGTDGQEYTFPVMAVNNGDHILVARSLTAMEAYFTTPGYNLFNVQLLDAGTSISQNGDDAIELFENSIVIETFGDPNCDPNGDNTNPTCVDTTWEYTDSWAYKSVPGAVWPSDWSYGGVDCTDGTNNIFESSCVYPLLASLSNNDFSKNELSIYPNPVNNGNLNIKSQISREKTIELYDMLGRSVLQTTLNSDVLNVSTVKSGLYLLKVSIDDRSSTTKIIIQ